MLEAQIDKVFEKLNLNLQTHFYCHVAEKLAEKQFDALVNRLGEVTQTQVLCVDERSVYRHSHPSEFKLHTDSVVSQVIAMYCCDAGAKPVATEVVNISDLFDYFNLKEIEGLKTLYFRDPFSLGADSIPFLRGNRQSYEVYYADWLSEPAGNKAQDVLMDKLKFFIEQKAKIATPVLLAPGESLFIMNRKLLHGRKEVDKNSSRKFKRVWIEIRS